MSFDKAMCMITFSNNADHQNTVYSMFNELNSSHEVYTFGIKNPKSCIAPKTEKNYYFECPLRPGITKGTFKISVLIKMAKIIKEKNIRYLYFESQHIWNAALMLLCPKTIKIVAVHDVIPHDGNKAMTLSNYVTCHLANHIILRNEKYKSTLSIKYKLPLSKITCMDLWRDYPQEKKSSGNKVFLCFGRIRKYKGFDILEKIIDKTPEIIYRIVGEPDEESKCIVEKLKSFSNVEVVDREVSDAQMIEEFADASWIILPYSSATQSGVITDACRLSRPVIAFNVGALEEQVINNKTGILVPEGNVDEFVSAIVKANYMNDEELALFSHEAYKFGYYKYSAAVASTKFVEVIYSVKK